MKWQPGQDFQKLRLAGHGVPGLAQPSGRGGQGLQSSSCGSAAGRTAPGLWPRGSCSPASADGVAGAQVTAGPGPCWMGELLGNLPAARPSGRGGAHSSQVLGQRDTCPLAPGLGARTRTVGVRAVRGPFRRLRDGSRRITPLSPQDHRAGSAGAGGSSQQAHWDSTGIPGFQQLRCSKPCWEAVPTRTDAAFRAGAAGPSPPGGVRASHPQGAASHVTAPPERASKGL